MQTWELNDLPEPPEMDDDYVNDLAQQSLEHEMSCEYSECENDGSGMDEYTDNSDINEDEQEEYVESEIARHAAGTTEVYVDELELEMMNQYCGQGEYADDSDMNEEELEEYAEQEISRHAVVEEGLKLQTSMLNQLQQASSLLSGVHLKPALAELERLPETLEKYSHPVATGFVELDEKLNGGLRGLTILGGLSATGKTAFALQIADYVAMSRPVLIFTLEMAPTELICRSLSRYAFVDEWQKMGKQMDWNGGPSFTGVECGYTTVSLLTTKCIPSGAGYKRYRTKIAPNLCFIEDARNIADIARTVVTFMQERSIRPFVVIDYLQILEELDPRRDSRRNIDLNVTNLRRLVRETGCSFLVISSLNRENYKERMSLAALKESGGIEYSSDCVLGLQFARTGQKDFDFGRETRNDPRALECVILKSRTSKAHVSIQLSYKPAYNLFWSENGRKTCI